ncbi:MAG: fimbria/pilus periplasmic chaperone [Gammaproteobacteria bacterium]|nr:fimbria/pilus periplasmic chaperone [Gammaproteobacteria bacterium]
MNKITNKSFNDISTAKRYLNQFIALSLLCFGFVPSIANAGANLMVTPTRIVFEERMRTAQITLMNNGTEQGDFRISFINQVMTDDGEFEAVKADEKGLFANSMVRYSPRQISLAPGQSQVVRLMLRKPRELANGEYRSHLLFQSIPKASRSSIASAMDTNPEGITVEIIPVVGISIPVIVRHGKLHSELKLDNAAIVPATEANPKSSISVDMHRSGNQSVYGDFRAIFTPNDGSESVIIALANGVAIYATNAFRQFTIPINMPSGTSLKDGKVRILFLEFGKDEETGLIAETHLTL